MAVSDIPRVLVLLDQGKSAEALELSAKLIDEMPTHVTSYVVHARVNESQGQYEDAFKSWRQALDLLPNSPQIRKGLLRTADKLARPASADYDFMRWTGDKHLSVNQFQFRAGVAEKVVEHELLSDPLVTDDGPESVPEDPEDVPVFVDTDLPISEEAFELDVASVEDAMDFVIEDAEEQPIVVTSSADVPISRPAAESAGEPSDPGDEVPVSVPPPSGKDRSPQGGAGAMDDIDNLIVELETAKIVPRGADDPAPPPNLASNVDGMVSETLARIFASQKQFGEAARIYDKLASVHPARENEFRGKAVEMRSKVS